MELQQQNNTCEFSVRRTLWKMAIHDCYQAIATNLDVGRSAAGSVVTGEYFIKEVLSPKQ